MGEGKTAAAVAFVAAILQEQRGLSNQTVAASGFGHRELFGVALDWSRSHILLIDEIDQVQGGFAHATAPPLCLRFPAADHFGSADAEPPLGWQAGDQRELDLPDVESPNPGDWRIKRRTWLNFTEWYGPVRIVDPLVALTRFLERLIILGHRADSFRQLVAQRVRAARPSTALTADQPPGEAVVASARVPRGPSPSRVTPNLSVVVTRGRQLAVV